MLAVIAIGAAILQREVASTITEALVLSVAWALLVAAAFLFYARGRGLVVGVALALALGAVVAGGSYYWFSVRDEKVDEDVAMAGEPSGEAARGAEEPKAVNVALAEGMFAGEDGHDGSGTATVIERPGGDRVLTFTDFDVDPGAAVEVWLTSGPDETEDRVELGGLKGNVGDQQYELPAGVDLKRHGTVVLYCTPFTVRIAVADLDLRV